MLKAYKYRIYPNNEQKVQIAKTFGCCRFVYNQTLSCRKEKYEKEKKSMSRIDCNNYCNREFSGQIKSATLSQVPGGKYYVSIFVSEDVDVSEVWHTS